MIRSNLETDLATYDRALRETREELVEARRRAEYLPAVIRALREIIASTRSQLTALDTGGAR